MNKRRVVTLLLTVLAAILSPAVQPYQLFAQEMPDEYRVFLSILGRKGDYKDHVLRVGIPRNDLRISVAGTVMPVAFGFGGWCALTRGDGGMDVMMGDLVLLQEEINPVMSALLENGLEVTALHNHFLWDEPRVFYMHLHGCATAAELARKVKPALDLIGHVGSSRETGNGVDHGEAPERGAVEVVEGRLDAERLAGIIGHRGEMNGPVYKITIGRDDLTVREAGALIGSRMGLNTWAAFVGTDDRAAVAGDVAMLESEVTPVLRILRKNALDVVAIHHHMTGIRPMIVFLHYWGVGPGENLAKGVRAALDELGKHPADAPEGHGGH